MASSNAKSLAARILQSAGPKSKASIINQSNIGNKNILASTPVAIVNLLLSGFLKGGITSGITQVVGETRTFKTNMCLFIIACFMRVNPEAVLVFFDSEFSAKPMMASFGIDEERVVYVPFEDLEEMKVLFTQIIKPLDPGTPVICFIDSISQVASNKEISDAEKGEVKVDMTRAKEMNSFFRIITPMVNIRDIPVFVINSFYESMDNKFADPTIKGGKQSVLSSDAVWFVSRAMDQDKDKESGKKELKGWFFTYKALKSRFVKEKSKFEVHVTYDGGIDFSSGILELAIEGGFIKQSGSWYEFDDRLKGDDFQKKFMRSQMTKEHFNRVLEDPEFDVFTREKYMVQTIDQTKNLDYEEGYVVVE